MALKKSLSGKLVPKDLRHYDRDFPGLLAELQNPDPKVRRWAARDLGSYEEGAATLCQQLKTETDPWVRSAIGTSLAKIGGPLVVDALVALLRSDDARVRNEAIEILMELPDDIALRMEELLQDPDPDVRIFAVSILEALRHPRVEEWLIGVVNQDPHVNVVAAALNLLGEVGTESALPALAKARERFADQPFIEFATTNAEKRIRTT